MKKGSTNPKKSSPTKKPTARQPLGPPTSPESKGFFDPSLRPPRSVPTSGGSRIGGPHLFSSRPRTRSQTGLLSQLSLSSSPPTAPIAVPGARARPQDRSQDPNEVLENVSRVASQSQCSTPPPRRPGSIMPTSPTGSALRTGVNIASHDETTFGPTFFSPSDTSDSAAVPLVPPPVQSTTVPLARPLPQPVSSSSASSFVQRPNISFELPSYSLPTTSASPNLQVLAAQDPTLLEAHQQPPPMPLCSTSSTDQRPNIFSARPGYSSTASSTDPSPQTSEVPPLTVPHVRQQSPPTQPLCATLSVDQPDVSVRVLGPRTRRLPLGRSWECVGRAPILFLDHLRILPITIRHITIRHRVRRVTR
jgi:hypothetical protein